MERFQGSNIIADLPTVDVSFDVDAFDRVIGSQGVRFVHWRSMRCPIGLTDRNSLRTPNHSDHDCSNGYLYKKAGVVVGSFTGNNSGKNRTDIGILDGSTVQVTFKRKYECTGDEVSMTVFDRFYLEEDVGTVVNWQVVEASPTGRDKMQFVPAKVEYVIDSNGKEYSEGKDFVVDGSFLRWVGDRPTYDARLSKGQIYTVRYQYVPFWYCAQLPRETRVSQVEDFLTGERSLFRMPYLAMLQREIVFENEQNGITDDDDPRDIPPPPGKTIFGAR